MSALPLPWRVERSANRWNPEEARVSATLHVEDFPSDPAAVAALFAALPPNARVGSLDDGWVDADWVEPSTEADRAALAAEQAEEALAAEFEAWKRQQTEATS